jgi:hypothetical protein
MSDTPPSKWGEGLGTPVTQCVNPNKPSYDPSRDAVSTLKLMDDLAQNYWSELTEWERSFLLSCYSRPAALTRKQVKCLHRIKSKLEKQTGNPGEIPQSQGCPGPYSQTTVTGEE